VSIIIAKYLLASQTVFVFGMSILDDISLNPSQLVTYYQWTAVRLGIVTYGGSFLLILLVGKRVDLGAYWRGMKAYYHKVYRHHWTGAHKEEKWKEYLAGDEEGKNVYRREDEESRHGRVSTASRSYI
jgi:hypothetical protein